MIYTLENNFLKVCVCDLGATLTKLIDKKTNIDLVLGFDDDQGYINNGGNYLGASVGRNANRIGDAEFMLNGVSYKLTVNDNMNQLHGGFNNFYYKRWEVKEVKNDEIKLTLFSKDLEEGFPGNLNAEVTYKLEDNNLVWTYSGQSDKDTVFNMTNHSYFCLGEDNCLNLELKVHTDNYSPTNEYALTLDKTKKVEGTPYDFREFTKIGDNLKKLENGIDNNYSWEVIGDKLMSELKNDRLQLNVYSDLPDMHLYTSGNLTPCMGKYGKEYDRFSAVCLECQFYPNGINYEGFIKPILKKNEKVSHYIKYEVISK